MSMFQSFGLEPDLISKLDKQSISTPTQIQQETIPVALSGSDILGSAETGSGKTLAFAAPIIHKLHQNNQKQAVIIAPTRELAEQISKNMQRLVPQKINIALLIGGASMVKQLQQLKRSPQIIIGTPGRMVDHLERKKLDMSKTSILVLDETDRMLDMGFTEQIQKLVATTPENRQTLLFSATMPKNIMHIAQKYLTNPIRIQVGSSTKPTENVKQAFINVEQQMKFNTLVSELEKRQGSVIVFVKTKRSADQLSVRLKAKDQLAEAIHGDLRYSKRQRVIRSFHQKKYRILVATDVAARGLDIPHIEHVINFDLPQCPEDYIHRIGRTGRGGQSGESLCLISQQDQFKYRAIKRFIEHGESAPKPNNKKRNSKKRFFKPSGKGNGKPTHFKKPFKKKTVKKVAKA